VTVNREAGDSPASDPTEEVNHMSTAENPATEPTSEEEFPESWLPMKHGDQPRTLVGEVTDYDLGPDFGWGRKWVATVTDDDGKPWSVWLSADVLVREFEDQRPMPGERITIRYMGKQDKPKGGGPGYHRFRVTMHRGEPQLPEFLTRPRLGAGQEESDIPADTSDLPPATTIPDADVVFDDDIPFN
jgi:hypothetical protein